MSITVKSIIVKIGSSSSNDFYLDLDGTKWKLDDFSLRQPLLSYNTLTFSMHKEPIEYENDINFNVCKEIIGKDLSLTLETESIENLSWEAGNDTIDRIVFQGIILTASGRRENSTYTINVEARSYEALLDNAPNCKSFEDLTLEEIINDVVEEYSEDIHPSINPRFTEPIPYCVQYNEPDYHFLLRLAQRYGEWLYNDGERFVFGQLPQDENTAVLKYPSQDITDYHVDLKMSHVAFNHVTSSYNAYDSTIKDGLGETQRSDKLLENSVFDASVEHYTKQTLQNLHSGGFADQDGRETILNVSTRSQARGKQAHMLVYSGNTYCSKLKIGSTLIIVDNYITNESTNAKTEIDHDEMILITDLVHTFSADETYSNHFTGIPTSCDYPPYANSDVYPKAPSCRAKVTDNEDPMDLGRVRVQFDWQAQLEESMMTPWLRIAQPYAGGGKGFSFIPEIGEEVMVDFEGGNAERPYVKGTLYNGMGDPDPAWVPNSNSSNPIKAIRTRNGHTIEIHDEGNDGYIRIYDNEKENYILTFSTDQKLIKLESTGNIELYAQNDIIMQAGNDMKITVGNNRSLEVGSNDTVDIGKDQSIRVAENMSEDVGDDKTQTTGRNYSQSVGENSDIKIGSNANTIVGKKHMLRANNVLQVAEDKLQVYSSTSEQKADNSLKIDGGMSVDVHAEIVRIS